MTQLTDLDQDHLLNLVQACEKQMFLTSAIAGSISANRANRDTRLTSVNDRPDSDQGAVEIPFVLASIYR